MILRPVTEEDLRELRFNDSAECASCAVEGECTIGAYRLPDYYVCEDCFLDKARLEVE